MFNKKEENNTESLTSSSNTIGKGSVMKGNLETFGNIRVEGKVIGNLITKSKAALGKAAKLEGTILSQNAEIEGHIVGTVEVSELLVLKSTAVIDGDIITDKLIIESGAVFNGSCRTRVKGKEIKIGNPEKGEGKILKAQS
ncbi:MAG: cytoskeletal protein CcmA (bactofilin family) [Gammaproteobacteria bacterium]|jgi:cytoskeletal protein CcmA (bactofilin family)